VAVPLQGLQTRVLKTPGGQLLTGYSVTASGTCSGGATLTLQNTSGGTSMAALPAGTWTIKITGPAGTQTKTVTLDPASGPATLDFQASK
jgi:hypothetical protein